MGFLQDKRNGFSGIELAIVIAVLSIFSAVAIPAFNCVRRRAISTAAQETIRQIKEECETNYIYGIDKFTSSNPNKYQISASGSNSCSGGTVTLTPEDTNLYPTYLYKFEDSELSYKFKGETGTSFVACNKLICGDKKPNNNNNEVKVAVINMSLAGDVDSIKCKYVDLGDGNSELNMAKWYLHTCEEFVQNVELCQHPYKLASSGPPFSFVPCSSLCEQAKEENWSSSWQQYHCGDEKYKIPKWIEVSDQYMPGTSLVQCAFNDVDPIENCTGNDLLDQIISKGYLLPK